MQNILTRRHGHLLGMQLSAINFLLQHPKVLRRQRSQFASPWKTAREFNCTLDSVIEPDPDQDAGSRLPSSVLTDITLKLIFRGIFVVASNLGIHEPGASPRALRCDFLGGASDNQSVVVVILCRRHEKLAATKRHAALVRARVRGLLPGAVRVSAFVALVEHEAGVFRSRMLRA